MSKALVNLSAVLAGGILSLAGLALSFAAVFFAMFYGLRLVCWLTKNDDWMFLMWFSIVLVPLGGILIFAVSGMAAVAYADRRRRRKKPQGFEVVPDSAPRDAG